VTHLAFSAWFPQRFLATINSTVIDWFQPWPESSLLSVARKFLDEVDLVSEPVRNAVVEFMPFSFGAVNNVSFVCLGAGSCTCVDVTPGLQIPCCGAFSMPHR
jgi:hypothetical protein